MTDRHQQKPYPLRMSDDLRRRLEVAAVEDSRSLHSEILWRLERTLRWDAAEKRDPESVRAEINSLAARLNYLIGHLNVLQADAEMLEEEKPREIVINMADLDVQVSPSGGLTGDPLKTEQNRQKREAAEREVAQNPAASQEPAQPPRRRITIRKRSS